MSSESARENKNAVFGATGGAPAGISQVDRSKNEFGLEIPVEEVVLPSNGVIYPESSSLHNRSTVPIRAMTTREEDILTSRALIKKGTVITELLKSCLTDKTIDVNEMIAGDRNSLMIAVRVTGYGAEYDAELSCSSCGEKAKHIFDLGRLGVKRLDIEPVRPGENAFAFKLPQSKLDVEFKFLTGRDEEEITVAQSRAEKLKLSQTDSFVSTKIRHSLLSANGKTDRALLNDLVGKLPARDSKALRHYIDAHEPGIDMTQEVECESCNHIEEVAIPIGVSFFWPQS